MRWGDNIEEDLTEGVKKTGNYGQKAMARVFKKREHRPEIKLEQMQQN